MKSKTNGLPQIVAFCCEHSAYQAADCAGYMRMAYPESLKLIRVPCAGRVDVIHILKALENGADGVLVLGCHEGACRHLSGNIRAMSRVDKANLLLQEVGMNGKRAAMFTLAPNQSARFAQIANETYERIKDLGPSQAKQAVAGAVK